MMAFVSRRKIPTLIQGIFLLILVLFMLKCMLKSAAKNLDEINYFGQNIGTVPLLKSEDASLSSACLSRDILNSHDVQMYSNRLPNKKYYLTIGIPTIAREIGNEYLMKTLSGLIMNQPMRKNKTDLLIVVQLGDEDQRKRAKLAAEIKEKYPHLINEGVLDIIQVYPKYYPSFDKLKQKFGDSKLRVKWRSKQAIDFSFLSCYCYGLGKYHLQLEDDVIASPHYYHKLKDFIEWYEDREKWFTLDASALGYIGKVYHNYDLNEIASFYYIFFDEMPVDLMENTWREIKGQSGRWRLRAASLFQHIGFASSLRNKEMKSQELYFDNHTQKFLGLNPPAKVKTDLIAEKTKLKAAYEKGDGYFWGRCQHKSNCYIKIIFENSLPLERIVVESGGNFALNDTVHHGSLQIGTYRTSNDCVHYEIANPKSFNKGTLDIVFRQKQIVNCLRINIQRQNKWVFIREINIWPGKS